MTLAIGASCEEGAVLVTDSLYQLTTPTGMKALLFATPRFEWLPGCNGAACYSGNYRAGWAAPLTQAATIETATAELIRDLAENGLSDHDWVDSQGQRHAPRGMILVAGRSQPGGVGLMHASTLAATEAIEPGRVVMTGAASAFAVLAERLLVPDTLDSLAAVVLELGRAVIAAAYSIYQAADLSELLDRLGNPTWRLPTFALPLHLARITPAGVTTERYLT